MAVLLALAASAVYGSADFLGGLATRREKPLPVVGLSQLAGLVALVLFLPLVGGDASAADLEWGVAAGAFGSVGIGLLYSALSLGKMSVVAPITAVAGIVVPVAVGLALGEQPGTASMVGVALACASIALISRGSPEAAAPSPEGTLPPPPGRRLGTGPIGRALGAGLAIGGFYVCLQRTGPGAGLWPLIAARSFAVCAVGGIIAASGRRLVISRDARALSIGAGLCDVLANVCYLLAVRRGLLSVVATLASLYPVSTVILARFVLGERLRLVQAAGLALATVAVVLIAGVR